MEKPNSTYLDGTYELKAGVTLLLIGAYYLLPPIPSKGGLSMFLLFPLGLILIVLSQILIDRLVRPKATPRKKEPLFSADITIFLAILVFLIWGVLLTFGEAFLSGRWMPILPALILAIILAITGLRSGQRRFLLLAFIGLLVSFILAWVNLGAWSANLFLAVMGVIFVAAGIYTFLNYLKNTRLPQEPTNEP